jgi:hypothetical protein
MKVREAQFYTEKVTKEDVKSFVDQFLKSTLPFLGVIDVRDIFSYNFMYLIIKRRENTITWYVKDAPFVDAIADLVFPFRLSDPIDYEPPKTKFGIGYYFITGKDDFISFMLKGGIEEIHLKIKKIFGGYIATGKAITKDKRSIGLLVTNLFDFLRVDLEKNPSIYIEVLEPIPKKFALSSLKPIFEERGISIGLDNFDPMQHTLVLGGSGTGKTKFIYVLVKALSERYGDSVRIVILDPHGELVKMFSKHKTIDFKTNYIEPLDVGERTPLAAQLITQLISSSLPGESKYAERVTYYTVNLLLEEDSLNLNNINAVLTDSSQRAVFTSTSKNEEVKRFFDQEYNDIYIHNFNDAVLPVLNFIGEYQLHMGGEKQREDLLETIKNNRITVITFDPHFFGHTMIRFLSGAVVNQMYLLALTEKLDKPTFFIVDEAPRVQSLAFKDILAETRKFNLFLCLSSQYLFQLRKEIIEGIVSNVRNIVAFKLNREDAGLISSIMEIKIEEFFKKTRNLKELEEAKKEMFVRLNVRECIVRLFHQGKYLIPMKVRVVDYHNWMDPDELEAEKKAK